jgi:ribosomal protein L6P/L9E
MRVHHLPHHFFSTRPRAHIGSLPLPLPKTLHVLFTPTQIQLNGPIGTHHFALPKGTICTVRDAISGKTLPLPNGKPPKKRKVKRRMIKNTDKDGEVVTETAETTTAETVIIENAPKGAEEEAAAEQELMLHISHESNVMRGTTRALLANYITGVTRGYTLPIRLVGTGYRASVDTPDVLSLKVGYSHPIDLPFPPGVVATCPKQDRIVLKGYDWQKITQYAAQIRKWKKPEPYNQKGIFVGDETIAKKEEGRRRDEPMNAVRWEEKEEVTSPIQYRNCSD